MKINTNFAGLSLTLLAITTPGWAEDNLSTWSAKDAERVEKRCLGMATAEQAKACFLESKYLRWAFLHGYERTGVFAYEKIMEIAPEFENFSWIDSKRSLDEYTSYCGRVSYPLKKAYCYGALKVSLEAFTRSVGNSFDKNQRVQLDQLYEREVRKVSYSLSAYIAKLPETTQAERTKKSRLLDEAIWYWYNDAPNFMDLREQPEIRRNLFGPDVPIVEGFRQAIRAGEEYVRLNPRDVDMIGNLVFLQFSVDTQERGELRLLRAGYDLQDRRVSAELAAYRRKMIQQSWEITERPLQMMKKYEAKNEDNFFYYVEMLDKFGSWSLLAKFVPESAIARSYYDYYVHLAQRAHSLLPKALDAYERQIQASPDGNHAKTYFKEVLKLVNSVMLAKARLQQITRPEMMGQSASAKESRGKTRRAVSFWLDDPAEEIRPENSPAHFGRIFVKSIRDVRIGLKMVPKTGLEPARG